MDAWAYAVVDNSQKRGTGNGEPGTGHLGTPVLGGKCIVQNVECATIRAARRHGGTTGEKRKNCQNGRRRDSGFGGQDWPTAGIQAPRTGGMHHLHNMPRPAPSPRAPAFDFVPSTLQFELLSTTLSACPLPRAPSPGATGGIGEASATALTSDRAAIPAGAEAARRPARGRQRRRKAARVRLDPPSD